MRRGMVDLAGGRRLPLHPTIDLKILIYAEYVRKGFCTLVTEPVSILSPGGCSSLLRLYECFFATTIMAILKCQEKHEARALWNPRTALFLNVILVYKLSTPKERTVKPFFWRVESKVFGVKYVK